MMQALQNMFTTSSAPDKEPPPSLLSEWKDYSKGSGSSAAQASTSQSDKLLASAEEGAATVKSFLSSAAAVVSSGVSGVASTASRCPLVLPVLACTDLQSAC